MIELIDCLLGSEIRQYANTQGILSMITEFYTPYSEELDDSIVNELVVKYRNGDSDAGQRVLGSLSRWIGSLIRNIKKPPRASDQEVYDEIYSDIMLGILKYDPQRSKITTYVQRIVCRRAPQAIAKMTSILSRPHTTSLTDKWNFASEILPLSEGKLYSDKSLTYEDDGYYRDVDELAEQATRLLGRLDHEKRRIVELRAQGKSVLECAKIMGISRRDCEDKIESIRQSMTQMMQEEGIDFEFIAKPTPPPEPYVFD